MFQCPGCSANVFFTPQSKSMRCPYCDTEIGVKDQVRVKYATEVKLNPAAFADIAERDWSDPAPKEETVDQTDAIPENTTKDEAIGIAGEQIKTAAEDENIGITSADLEDTMEITVFTCTQCGAEIMAYEDTAVTFCSYCDTPTPLLSRLSNKRKPKYVVPFRITKDKAKEAYKKAVKKVPFADFQLIDELKVDKIRGIYMPYYLYSVRGEQHFEGLAYQIDYSEGKMKREYKIISDLNVYYDEIAFDASSSFSDEMSNGVMPYIRQSMVDFNINCLSGYYADTYDVAPEIYDEDAKNYVVEDIKKYWSKQLFVDYTLEGQMNFDNSQLKVGRRDLALFPVWFVANRYGKRVSYAAINGATGKVYVEVPISFGKFLATSIGIALALFVLLQMFTLTPQIMMSICIMAALILIGHLSDMSDQLFYHENGYLDKGYLAKMDEHRRSLAKWTVMANTEGRYRHKKCLSILSSIAVVAIPMLAFILMLIGAGANKYYAYQMGLCGLFYLAPVVGHINKSIQKKIKEITNMPSAPFKWKLKYLLKPAISILAALIILIINPAEDLVYYIADISMTMLVVGAVIDAINQYNKLTTRPLPQFNKRGGDEDVHI